MALDADPASRILNFSGRTSRLGYLTYMLAIVVTAFTLMLLISAVASLLDVGPDTAGVPVLLACMPVVYAVFAATVRRLHDLGRSGWFSILLLVPLLNLFLIMFLMLAPGAGEDNAHGPAPRTSSYRRSFFLVYRYISLNIVLIILLSNFMLAHDHSARDPVHKWSACQAGHVC